MRAGSLGLLLLSLTAAGAWAGDDPAPRPHRITVRVVGPDGTAPHDVTISFTYGNDSQTYKGTRARAVFDGKPDGGTVRAYAAVDSKGDVLPWAPARADAPAGGGEVELRMERGLAVEGRVVDAEGRPLEGVTVTAYESEGFPPGAALSRAQTGVNGEFHVRGLGTEPVDLVVEETAETPASVPLRARPGDRGVALTVRKGVPARLRLVDADGKPVAGAHLYVMRHVARKDGEEANSVVSTDSSPTGIVDVPALDPTLRLSLTVEPPRDRDDLSPLEIDPWVPASGDFTVPGGFTATLNVFDTDGRPLAARVTRIHPSDRPGRIRWTTSSDPPDAHGVLRVRMLPLGPARFMAFTPAPTGLFPAGSPPVEVDEKRPTAELRIPTRGLRMTVKAPGATRESHVGFLLAQPGTYRDGVLSFDLAEGGEAVLDRIAPGKYVVLVLGRDGYRGDVGRVEVPAFAGEEVVVPMRPPLAARARLKAPAGANELAAMIFAGDHLIAQRTAGPEGHVVFDGLPPGTYAVLAFGRNGKQRLQGLARVEAGSEAEIELKPAD